MSCSHLLVTRGRRQRPLTLAAHIQLAPEPRNAAVARQFVRTQLLGHPEPVIDDASLLASELVTNAILYAETAPVVGVAADNAEVLITVTDRRHDRMPLLGRMPTAEDMVEMSRGIAIVCSLASDFGWQLLPGSAGKVVWFTLNLDAR